MENSEHLVYLKKKIRWLTVISVLLPLLILAGIYVYIDKTSFNVDELNFRDFPLAPVETPKAITNIKAYRKNLAFSKLSIYKLGKTNIITHDSESISKYFLDVYPAFVKSHPLPNNLHWYVGFYPMICKDTMHDKIRPRICMYFIPTLKENNKPIDFYKIYNNSDNLGRYLIYYTSTSNINDKQILDDKFIYDEGSLDP